MIGLDETLQSLSWHLQCLYFVWHDFYLVALPFWKLPKSPSTCTYSLQSLLVSQLLLLWLRLHLKPPLLTSSFHGQSMDGKLYWWSSFFILNRRQDHPLFLSLMAVELINLSLSNPLFPHSVLLGILAQPLLDQVELSEQQWLDHLQESNTSHLVSSSITRLGANFEKRGKDSVDGRREAKKWKLWKVDEVSRRLLFWKKLSWTSF